MSLKMKLNVVNKYEYKENKDYREVIIKIPRETESLEIDFRYLGIDYNLSINDAHVLECKVIDTEDPFFSEEMTRELSDIIEKANENGYITPFQDIKKVFTIMKSINAEDKDKLLAVLEIKKDRISNMEDVVKYIKNLDCFEYYNNINTNEEYAQRLIDDGDISFDDVIDYINMEELGEAYINGSDGIFTNQGLIFETSPIKENVQNSILKNEEEEFE